MNLQTHIETTVASVASKSMSGGAVTSIVGWFTENHVLTLLGVVTTLTGFIINWIYRSRQDSRERCEERRRQELHDLTMANLRDRV